MLRIFPLLFALLFLAIGAGCSGSMGITAPDELVAESIQGTGGGSSPDQPHGLLGLYRFIADPEAEVLDIIPLREVLMHLNVLPFLEPPVLLNLTLESLGFDGNIIEADIGLRHPFLGLTEFTGFDVCGILISNGSYAGYADGGITIAGPGDLYLVNADGHARWWNPDEFPPDLSAPVFGYIDGLLGTPDDIGNFNATVNGYKYFADGLGPLDDVSTLNTAKRGLFSPGSKNIRHYTIDTGGELVFNYAIDACWESPAGPGPWNVPDDFGEGANRVEPYYTEVAETTNSLWHDGSSFGGVLSLDINIYDWFNLDQDWIRLESPGAFTAVDVTVPAGGGVNYSTFQVDLVDITLSSSDDLMILVTTFSEDIGFQDFLPGKTTAAYKVHYAAVSTEPTGPPPIAVADSIPKIGFVNFAGDFIADGSQGQIDLYEWDFDGDGSYDWSNPVTGNTTYAYAAEDYYDATLKVSNAGGFDTDSLEIRMIDPLPIISNGNFWDAAWDDWTIVQGGQGTISNTIEDDDTFKHYVKFLRTGSGSDGGQSRAMQVLNIDVTEYDELYFNVFFKIITQGCPGDGWWGQYGGWGDFPFHVWIFYTNQNDEPRYVHYGYLIDSATTQYNYVWEWDLPAFHSYHPYSAYYEYEAFVPQNEWQERQTIDLMTLGDDAPKELTQIWIWTMGWDYEVHWILPWFSDH